MVIEKANNLTEVKSLIVIKVRTQLNRKIFKTVSSYDPDPDLFSVSL